MKKLFNNLYCLVWFILGLIISDFVDDHFNLNSNHMLKLVVHSLLTVTMLLILFMPGILKKYYKKK